MWCYAHVLNLVISNCVDDIIKAMTLFGLLKCIFTFVRESHIRMNVRKSQTNTNVALGTINETRWWEKEYALKDFYASLIITLHKIYTSKDHILRRQAKLHSK